MPRRGNEIVAWSHVIEVAPTVCQPKKDLGGVEAPEQNADRALDGLAGSAGSWADDAIGSIVPANAMVAKADLRAVRLLGVVFSSKFAIGAARATTSVLSGPGDGR
ncbi:MAG TPA: hypothetical protein VL984_06215 [Acidimicrobiales bacterium]|nr:hypothetical protein [Acidimicrobiales bacterium]